MADPARPGLPVLAEVVRGGFVESRHHGSVVAVAPDGVVLLGGGEPGFPTLPRSANKPLQAVGMLRAGLDIDGELLAIATSSHSGEPGHVEAVRRLLAAYTLDEADLGNTPSLPLGVQAAADVQRAGGAPSPVLQNCSGKHAAMLATCAVNGWPLQGYLDPGHPLQKSLQLAVEALAGERVATVVVDGCGAPQHALSLVGLARAVGRLTVAEGGTPERRVADAMRGHPWFVAGTGRDVTALMESVPGLLAKDGAEGVFVAALADGTGVAVKIEDGGDRARTPVLLAALGALGVPADALSEVPVTPVLGGGRPVGEIRALLEVDGFPRDEAAQES